MSAPSVSLAMIATALQLAVVLREVRGEVRVWPCVPGPALVRVQRVEREIVGGETGRQFDVEEIVSVSVHREDRSARRPAGPGGPRWPAGHPRPAGRRRVRRCVGGSRPGDRVPMPSHRSLYRFGNRRGAAVVDDQGRLPGILGTSRDNLAIVTSVAKTGVVFIGAGIMSSTLGALLRLVEPDWSITMIERASTAPRPRAATLEQRRHRALGAVRAQLHPRTPTVPSTSPRPSTSTAVPGVAAVLGARRGERGAHRCAQLPQPGAVRVVRARRRPRGLPAPPP